MNSLKCPKSKSLSHCLTQLFPIYQNKPWTIRQQDYRFVDPSSHRIILKIVGFLGYIEMMRCDAAMRSTLRAPAADVEMSDNIRSCMQLEFPSWQIRVKTVLLCTYFGGDWLVVSGCGAKAAGTDGCIGPVWMPSPALRGFWWYGILLIGHGQPCQFVCNRGDTYFSITVGSRQGS